MKGYKKIIIVVGVLILFGGIIGAALVVDAQTKSNQQELQIAKRLNEYNAIIFKVINADFLTDEDRAMLIGELPHVTIEDGQAIMARNNEQRLTLATILSTEKKSELSNLVLGGTLTSSVSETVIEAKWAKCIQAYFQKEFDLIYNTKRTDTYTDEEKKEIADIEIDIRWYGVDIHNGEASKAVSKLEATETYNIYLGTIQEYRIVVNNANVE